LVQDQKFNHVTLSILETNIETALLPTPGLILIKNYCLSQLSTVSNRKECMFQNLCRDEGTSKDKTPSAFG